MPRPTEQIATKNITHAGKGRSWKQIQTKGSHTPAIREDGRCCTDRRIRDIYVYEKRCGSTPGEVWLKLRRGAAKTPDKCGHPSGICRGDVAGVYSVAERLPTRIILTDELKGERYAPYRALSNRPTESDVEYMIDAADKDEEKRKYLRVILGLVAAKHPEMIEEIKGRDKSMTAKWMEIFKDEIAVERAEARIQAYAEMVDEGDLTVERAAEKLGMTVQEFQRAVEKLKVTA